AVPRLIVPRKGPGPRQEGTDPTGGTLPGGAGRPGAGGFEDDGQAPGGAVPDGRPGGRGAGALRRRRLALDDPSAADDALPRRPVDDAGAEPTQTITCLRRRDSRRRLRRRSTRSRLADVVPEALRGI